ncbi:MAG: PhzF family phenazine biosynthesis protein [Pseudomonadota bacterium]
MTRYLVYDVFTDTAFTGNPLAVVPDAQHLPEAQLQQIAREFNFSEAAFVYPPDDPAHTARLRILTPNMEIPFAGHPTIGTAIALRDLGHAGPMVLELGVGPIPCRFDGDLAAFTTTTPLTRVGSPDPALVADCLGLSKDRITTATHAPVQAGVGLPFVIVELLDHAALAACTPVTETFKEGAKHFPSGLDFAIFAYVRRENAVSARMFAPLDNIPEDPATGSAAAALTALLCHLSRKDQTLTIIQGEAMGRRSVIHASATRGTKTAITIAGQAVRVMDGHITL